VAVWCGAAASSRAQLEVSARLAHLQVLQYEPVIANLEVTNTSPIPMPVGGEGGASLSFRVEREAGRLVDSLGSDPGFEPFMVPPRQTVARDVNLGAAYDLRRTGSYTLSVLLEYRGNWSRSGKLFLDVVPGLVLHQQRVMTRSGPRTVSLRTQQRDRVQHLFCRIEDEQRQICFGVHDLGRLLRHDPQGILVDEEDRIHVLHQSSPSRYTHSVFAANGQPLRQEFVSKGRQVARLAFDEAGEVIVEGGLDYQGELSVDRPRIRPFNPFPNGVPDRVDPRIPTR
jgi:hypothetical protein